MKINIDPSHRWLFLGATGTGKSEGAKYFLRKVAGRYPVVIVDPKEFWLGRNPKWAGRREPGTIDKPRLVEKFNEKLGVQCYQPDVPGGDGPLLDEFCYRILDYGRKKGGIFVYFDECDGIATANVIPRGLSALWKKGRALEVGAWIGNQTATGIPKIFKSQAETWVVFDVPDPDDRKLIATSTASPHVEVERLPKFHYWYFHRHDLHEAVHMPPLDIKNKHKGAREDGRRGEAGRPAS